MDTLPNLNARRMAARLFDNDVSIDQIFWLSSASLPDGLRDILEDDQDEILHALDMPERDEETPAGDLYAEIFSSGKTGFIVQVRTPSVESIGPDGGLHHVRGAYWTGILYTDAFDEEFVDALLAWKEGRIRKFAEYRAPGAAATPGFKLRG